jgi:pimeloyl-ACP methyl ester carboxylesterase
MHAAPRDWKSIDWRRHLRRAAIDGRDVNYVDIGGGPPILLLHGLSCSWRFWLANIPSLARRRRVIAVDLPGFGASEEISAPMSMAELGHWCGRMVEHLGIVRVDVAGSSMGGFVALEMAMSRPDSVRSLTLISPAGIAVKDLRVRRRFRMINGPGGEKVAILGARLTRRLLRRPRTRELILASVFAHPERVDPELVAELAACLDRPAFVPALTAMVSEPLSGRLGALDIPTLIIWGEHDRVTPPRDGRQLADELPRAELVTVPEAGHLAMIERPELVDDLIESFLSRS